MESRVLALRSVSSVVSGKHYNRRIQIYKLVFEAILQADWYNFKNDGQSLQDVTNRLQDLRTRQSEYAYERVVQCDGFIQLYTNFLKFCSTALLTTGCFWLSYIELVQVVLNLIRATQTGNLNLHLACIKDFLTWCFAYDRQNYARYLSVYWCDMLNLKSSHPQVENLFQNGDFVVQRSKESRFA